MSNFPGLLFYSDKLVYRAGRHIALFFGLNALFIWVIIMRGNDQRSVAEVATEVFVNSFFFFGYAYLTAYILVPGFLSKGRYILFALLFLIAGIVISVLKFLFSDYVFYSAISASLTDKPYLFSASRLIVNTKDMSFIVAVFLIAKFTKDNHNLDRRVAELQQVRMKAEIRLLKNQLDPHVVFNNLNNLYCLSLNNSELVFPTVSRLKSLLTYFFVSGKSRSVPLQLEIAAIEDYIFLEKLRYGKRLDIEFVTKGASGEWELAPFTLFSFVENCFNHGASIDSAPSWIRIKLEITPGLLVFNASNSKPESNGGGNPEKVERIQYDIREKFDLLYPEKHKVSVEDRKDVFHVVFELKG